MIFTGTIYLIYSFKLTKENNLLLLLFIFLSFWFFCGDLYRVFIWESASFNYGWPAFFSLLFFKLFFSLHDDNMIINNFLICILFLLFSFIVGWGHEAISPVVFLSITLYFCYAIKNKIEISKFKIFGAIGFTLGLCFLLFAPGNFVRYNLEKNLFIPFDFFPFSRYLFALFRNGYFLLYFTMPVFIVMVLVIMHSIKNCNNTLDITYKLKLMYCLFLLLFSSFFTFVILSYATSIIITPLIIMLIIIERYLDYTLIDKYIEYFFVAIMLLLLLYILQGTATVYYVIVKGKIIEHGFKLVS